MNRWRLLPLVFVVACAGQDAMESAARAPGPAAPKRDAWAAQSWEDRHDTMTFLVLPEMSRAFQRFENKPDPDLTCLSCHGPNAEKVSYKMPSGSPLDPAHLPRKDSADAREAKLAAFMIDEVTPSLGEMLGKADVGCFTCHTRTR